MIELSASFGHPILNAHPTSFSPSFVVQRCLLLWSFLVLISSGLLNAQPNLKIEQFGTRDGLTGNIVSYIHQDSKGFMWFFFWNGGVIRYDGYTFERIYPEPEAGFGEVIHLSENKGGLFWFLSRGEVWQYDPVLNRAEQYVHKLDESNVVGLKTMGKKQTYVVTEQGMYELTTLEALPRKVLEVPARLDWWVYFRSVTQDSAGHFWLGTYANGIYEFSETGEKVNQYPINSKLRDGWQAADGSIWFVAVGGLYRKGLEDKDFVRIEKGHPYLHGIDDEVVTNSFAGGNHLHSAHPDPHGFIWIPYDNSNISVFHPERKILFNLEGGNELLPLRTIVGDENHVVWIGTSFKGLSKVNLEEKRFQRWLNTSNKSGWAHGLTQDGEGRIYLSSEKGLWVLDSPKGDFRELGYNGVFADDGQPDKEEPRKEINYGAVLAEDGQLWVGSKGESKSLYKLDVKTGTAQKVTGAAGIKINMLRRDGRARLWACTDEGMMTVEQAGSGLYVLKETAGLLKDISVSCLFEDSQGNLWAGTPKGLYGKPLLSDKWEFIPALDLDLPPQNVQDIIEAPEGVLWMLENPGDILRFEVTTRTFQRISLEKSDCATRRSSLLMDDFDQLWISTQSGLIKLDTKTLSSTCILVDEEDQLLGFDPNNALKGKDGRFYFAGLQGVAAFDPEDFQEELGPGTKIMLSHFRKYDGKLGRFVEVPPTKWLKQPLMLDYRDLSFTFQFALSDYRFPTGNTFAYRLSNLDTSWIQLGGERTLTLATLPPGDYRLEVKASSWEGVACPDRLVIDIHKARAWYTTVWFLLLCILSVSGIVFGGFRIRLRSLRKRQVELEQIVEIRTQEITEQKAKIELDKAKIEQQANELKALDKEKSRFFANISHELRTPLTLIQAPLNELLKRESLKEDQEVNFILRLMRKNSQKLLNLIEEILDLSKLESDKLALIESPVHFQTLFNRLASAFDSQAAIRNIEFSIRNELDQEAYVLLDRSKFEKVLNNLLSNAFKFTPDEGRIHIEALPEGERILIQVIDSGRGIHPTDLPFVFDRYYQSKLPERAAEGGTGIGLALARQLTELMQGSLEVESTWEKGSTFKFRLPYNKTSMPMRKEEVWETPKEATTLDWEHLEVEIPRVLGQQARILIVEDHADMRNFIQGIMRPYFEVKTVMHGEQAVKWLDSPDPLPDLIISDVMMPEMDGMELLRRVRANPQWKGIPMILLTARAGQTDRLDALYTGVDDYLTKPFQTEELLARAINLLSNLNQRKEWMAEQVQIPALTVEFAADPHPLDEEWIQKVEQIVKSNIGNRSFKVTDLAAEMAVSQSKLLRKLRMITGLTPEKYIREIKLRKALLLLENRAVGTVSELAYAIGFDTPEYFSKIFVKRFGKRPTEYLN